MDIEVTDNNGRLVVYFRVYGQLAASLSVHHDSAGYLFSLAGPEGGSGGVATFGNRRIGKALDAYQASLKP